MPLLEHIYSSLENWGSYPVLKELTPGQETLVLSAGDLLYRIEACAGVLQSMGVRERSAVPLFLNNAADFPVLFYALLKIRAVPVMVKTDYRFRELQEIFRNLNPDILICENSHLEILEPWLKDLCVIARLEGPSSSPDNLRIVQRGKQKPERLDIPDDAASINYTYRGYGYPLGSITADSQYVFGADIIRKGLAPSPGERLLVILPMSHIFTLIACVTAPIFQGTTAIISRSINPRQLFSIIEKESIDYIHAIPEILELLARTKPEGGEYPSLKGAVTGGSYLSPAKHAEYTKTFGMEILHGYGLTEVTPASRNIRGLPTADSIGTVCEGIDCVLKDGEILLKTPEPIHGYYRRPEESADAFDGAYFRTGDVGHYNGDHLVFDREIKRTRKINGNLVDLKEIENCIGDKPDVDRYRLDYDKGTLSAFVSFRGDDESGKEGLRQHLNDSLARYKVPRIITGREI